MVPSILRVVLMPPATFAIAQPSRRALRAGRVSDYGGNASAATTHQPAQVPILLSYTIALAHMRSFVGLPPQLE